MRLHVYGGGGGRLALHALMGVMMVMIVFLACSGLPVTGAMGGRWSVIHTQIRAYCFQVVCPSWIDPDAWRSASLAFFRTSVLVTELFHELRNSSKLRPLKGTARKKIVNS